jgi:hypothetical protein
MVKTAIKITITIFASTYLVFAISDLDFDMLLLDPY